MANDRWFTVQGFIQACISRMLPQVQKLLTFFFEESECSLARFSITGLALWIKLMIFILSGSKLMQVHVCLWDRLLWEASLHQELTTCWRCRSSHTDVSSVGLCLHRAQSCQTFQRKPSTIRHISRLELSVHVSHVCWMAARVQSPQWSIHITLRGDNKKKKEKSAGEGSKPVLSAHT